MLIDRSCLQIVFAFSSLSEVVARHTLSKKLEEDGIKYNLQVSFIIFGSSFGYIFYREVCSGSAFTKPWAKAQGLLQWCLWVHAASVAIVSGQNDGRKLVHRLVDPRLHAGSDVT